MTLRRRGRDSSWLLRLAPAWALVVAVLGWEAIVAIARIPVFLLPAPSGIIARLARDPGYLVAHMANTGFEALAGLAVAIAIACVMAVLITRFRLLERVVYPYLVLIQVTPIVAIAPLLIVWLGT